MQAGVPLPPEGILRLLSVLFMQGVEELCLKRQVAPNRHPEGENSKRQASEGVKSPSWVVVDGRTRDAVGVRQGPVESRGVTDL